MEGLESWDLWLLGEYRRACIDIRPVVHIIIPVDLGIVVCNGTASPYAFTANSLAWNGNGIIRYNAIYFLARTQLIKISHAYLHAVAWI